MVSENICNGDSIADGIVLPLLLVLILMSAPVSAQVYKCTDDAGKVQYTDTPCGESSTVIRESTAPSAAPASQGERMQKTQRLLDAMQAERNEKKRLDAEARAEKEKRKRNCGVARDRYRRLTTASHLYDVDEEGNRVVLNDSQRAQSEARAKADVARWCE